MTRRESGSASVYVLAGCLLIGLLALVPVATGAVAIARHRAATTADAAALAAARTADAGEVIDATAAVEQGLSVRGCARAGVVAMVNKAQLVSCTPVHCSSAAVSLQVEVSVAVTWAGLPLPTAARVTGVARAGAAGCLPNVLP